MKVYIARNGNKERMKAIRNSDLLGLMFNIDDHTHYKDPYEGIHAVDNGAFSAFISGVPWDSATFLNALSKYKTPDFIVIPDIVAGGKASLRHSRIWRQYLPDRFTWFLAVQDGLAPTMIPDDLLRKIGGIFVGGSMDWKLRTAEDWINFAHGRGLKAHVGRIGTLQGLLNMQRKQADSVDSSNYTQNKRNWRELMQWHSGEHKPLEAYPIAEG